ncbi:hypothetical lipoprotein precursor (plasmid) [Glutamicibacter arilaitensis Re117]|uniref:Hypothetical lipoprotein n=1 Tax=Glutamicibacter arilaitensis (strain DSM 16368 / CIP 108037 / IAM 15318 / JCM 13566 / NCIMB 14258 / Re117) TaxID=861360 RepID=A0ABP1TYK9_GLUAR|nr:DUF192 domain-containing protein [Glutamicibacter arilaitensis]CBQ74041.1 hypothetical lipoprotein precursor [Glutamicibacter arilaitensis Re117]
MRAHAAAAVALAGLLAGCASTPPEPATALVALGSGLEFQVEHARTADEQRTGLAGRSELSEDQGILFSFASQSERQVWMAGMKFPLDVAWIADHRVIAVQTLEPCTEVEQDRCPRWTSPNYVDALLEVRAGALAGIDAGTVVTIREENP